MVQPVVNHELYPADGEQVEKRRGLLLPLAAKDPVRYRNRVRQVGIVEVFLPDRLDRVLSLPDEESARCSLHRIVGVPRARRGPIMLGPLGTLLPWCLKPYEVPGIRVLQRVPVHVIPNRGKPQVTNEKAPVLGPSFPCPLGPSAPDEANDGTERQPERNARDVVDTRRSLRVSVGPSADGFHPDGSAS